MKTFEIAVLLSLIQCIVLTAVPSRSLAPTQLTRAELKSVRPGIRMIGRINAVKVMAMKNNKIPVEKIPTYEWQGLRSVPVIKPAILKRARDPLKPSKKAIKLVETLDTLLKEYGKHQDTVLRNTAILKTMDTEKMYKYGYDTDKFNLLYEMKQAEKRMGEILDMDIMKTSVLDDKKSVLARTKLDSVRKNLEKEFGIETEADVAFKAKLAEEERKNSASEAFRGKDYDDEWQ